MVVVLTIAPLVAVTVMLPVSTAGGATLKLDVAWLAVMAGTSLSVAVTVKELVPCVVGVPVMPPVDVLRVKPAGKAPELME
jgi:hypothetical protein